MRLTATLRTNENFPYQGYSDMFLHSSEKSDKLISLNDSFNISCQFIF